MIPLHEGHEPTESAAAATLTPEMFALSVIGFLVVAAVLGYVIDQYVRE